MNDFDAVFGDGATENIFGCSEGNKLHGFLFDSPKPRTLSFFVRLWRVLFAVTLLAVCGAAQTNPVVIQSTVSCATSIDGSVVGMTNPLNPPNVAVGFSGTLPAGNYYVQNAWYDAAGHITLVGPEVQIQLSGTGQLQVNLPDSGMPATSVGMKVYIGASSGSETLQGATTGGATFTQSSPLAAGAAVPATNNTVCQIVANDAGWPTGTGYTVGMTSPAGDVVPGWPMQWQLLGPGTTTNLSNGLPLYNGTVTYPIPILARPYNHAQQSISGPLSMTNYNIVSVGALGVGTAVPGWPIDVENGAINASGGYILNGGQGVTTNQCLAAGSDPFHTFNVTVNCVTSAQTLFYQTIQSNGTAVPQKSALNFSANFVTGSSGDSTNVDLVQVGTAGTFTSPSSLTLDAFGRVTSITSGSRVTATQTSVTRTWATIYQNTTGGPVIEQGQATTPGGGSTGNITCSDGPSSPSTVVWSQEYTATVNNATVQFTCLIPQSYFYTVTVTGDISTTPTSWLETTLQ